MFLGGVVDRQGDPRPCAGSIRDLVDAGAALMTLGVEEYLEIERAVEQVLAGRLGRVLAHAGASAPAGSGPEVAGAIDAARAEAVAWLRTVPLWLDLPGLRVVHGCWSTRDIALLRDTLGGNDLADDDGFATTMRSDLARAAIRTLLIGATVPLPEHLWCLDARGEVVRSARVRWWARGPRTYRQRAVLPGACTDLAGRAPAVLDDSEIPDEVPHEIPLDPDGIPVVIARSSCAAGPIALSATVMCLGVAGRGGAGPIAYRWSGEAMLDVTRLVHPG